MLTLDQVTVTETTPAGAPPRISAAFGTDERQE
jgi:hypothetical protein